MSEKVIRIVKLDASHASGWGVEPDGTIRIEVSAPSWEALEKKSKNEISVDMDHVLAETIEEMFLHADC